MSAATNLLKSKAAGLSLGYNVVLTTLKLGAAVLTGSVSLLSEGVHSATDVIASGFAFLSVRAASAPPDEDHPYGHGKIESVASFGEAVMLLGIVVYIVFEAVNRLRQGSEVHHLDIGLWVMGISALSSLAVGHYVNTVAKQTDSMALRSNGQHLMVDFWTSIGVLVALGVTRTTGWVHADAIFALILAGWITHGAWGMVRESFDHLVDKALPAEEIAKIRVILDAEPGCLSWHQLRARHSGETHYIEAHVVVPNDWSVVQAHDLADRIELKIAEALSPAQVVIHIDPFDPTVAPENIR